MVLSEDRAESHPLAPAAFLISKTAVHPLAIGLSIVFIILPILFLLLLPGVIFNGYHDADSLQNSETVLSSLAQINQKISAIMQDSYKACLEQVEQVRTNHAHSEVIDLVPEIHYTSEQIISQYCAKQNENFAQISIPHLLQTVANHSNELYSYTIHEEEKLVSSGDKTETIPVTIYTIRYAGEDYWADEIFALTESEKAMADAYALNLNIFLSEYKTASANKTHQSLQSLLANDNTPFVGGSWGSPFPNSRWQEHVSSPFGIRPTPGGKGGTNNHTGLDIALPKGTPIHALNDGVVLYTHHWENSYGYHVAINHHGGYVSLYAHCSELLVTPGQTIRKGDVIAKVGSTGNSTGNHCHVEIIKDGKPLDPAVYLP